MQVPSDMGAQSVTVLKRTGVASGRGAVCGGRGAGGVVSGGKRIVAARGRGAGGAYCRAGGGGPGSSLVHCSARAEANQSQTTLLEAVKDADEAEEAVQLVQAFEAAEAEEAEEAVQLVLAFEAAAEAEIVEPPEEAATAKAAQGSSHDHDEREQLKAIVLRLLTQNACFGLAGLVAKRVAHVPNDRDAHALLQDKDLLENVVYQTMCSVRRELKPKGKTLSHIPPPWRRLKCSFC